MTILAPLSASAADGTVTFNGKVTDKTCTISTPGGKDFSVNLPTVSLDAIEDDQGAGRTPFSINLTNCSQANVATYFEPGPSVELGTGHLINLSEGSANGASNVQLRLRGSNNEILRVLASGADQVQNNSQWVAVAADGTANLNYYVEYIEAHTYVAATPGEVTGNVKYTIIYN